MKRLLLLNTPIDRHSRQEVLEKILKFIKNPTQPFHIVSINPENVVIANTNTNFASTVNESDLALADGIGIIFASKILSRFIPKRIPGVDLFQELLQVAGDMRLRVLLIGAKAKIAESIAKCYTQSYPEAKYIGIQGYQNISNPSETEEETIRSIVRAIRPHFIFTAFGSPAQEQWFTTHKDILQGIIYMGVGGGFDYISGVSKRPPLIIRSIGLEWLYRLIFQPYRIKRQVSRLPFFVFLVLKEWFQSIMQKNTHEKTSHHRS